MISVSPTSFQLLSSVGVNFHRTSMGVRYFHYRCDVTCRRWRKCTRHTNSKTVFDRFRLQQCGSRKKKKNRKKRNCCCFCGWFLLIKLSAIIAVWWAERFKMFVISAVLQFSPHINHPEKNQTCSSHVHSPFVKLQTGDSIQRNSTCIFPMFRGLMLL